MSDNDLDASEAYLDACFSDEIGRDVLLSLHRLSAQLQTDNECNISFYMSFTRSACFLSELVAFSFVNTYFLAVDVTAIIDESLNAFHSHQQEVSIDSSAC
jgi:hypothetical protein